MLTNIRAFLANKKTYLSMAAAIIGGLIAYGEGAISLNELLVIIVNATGFITVKAGVNRAIKNGNGK